MHITVESSLPHSATISLLPVQDRAWVEAAVARLRELEAAEGERQASKNHHAEHMRLVKSTAKKAHVRVFLDRHALALERMPEREATRLLREMMENSDVPVPDDRFLRESLREWRL